MKQVNTIPTDFPKFGKTILAFVVVVFLSFDLWNLHMHVTNTLLYFFSFPVHLRAACCPMLIYRTVKVDTG